MDITKRPVFSGDLREAYERELKAIEEQQLLKCLWSHDETLWAHSEALSAHFRSNLDFLQLPEQLPQIAGTVLGVETVARTEGLTDRVLIAFENAHLLCESLLNICPLSPPLRCLVLHSSHPSEIQRSVAQIDPEKTLFLMVNKSGYRVEDHSLFLYFQKEIQKRSSPLPARHFVAEAEPNSFLATVAGQYGFRHLLELPPAIPALFCSLVDIAALLVALAHVQPEVIRMACREMKKAHVEPVAGRANPACELAALLSASAAHGRKFIVFLASKKLAPFADSLCRLVGGSLGKGETGLYPLSETESCRPEVYQGNSSFVILRHGEEMDPFLTRAASELRSHGIPLVEIPVNDPLDLLRETFLWQVATTLAGARVGIDPFDAAEVRLPRALTTEMLNNYSQHNDTLKRRPRILEGDIQLFAEARTRQEISQLNLTECLLSFFYHRERAEYFGLYAFMDPEEPARAVLDDLRNKLTQALALPVLLAWGPRSFETYGYLLRAGAPAALNLIITADSEGDVAIPGTTYSFGQLYLAMALGQFEVLSAGTGLALRLHLSSASAGSLSQLQVLIQQALRRLAA
ncbi:MAG TPA: hypothetical protein VGR58_01650 [Candidatus Acidoferrum sp.]|nr:hypothetical protein [Candidatus Acidoferrum sp.]